MMLEYIDYRMINKKFKYSCIIDTPYSLFLYLLMCKNGDWEKTVFFVGDGINESYLRSLKKVVRLSSNYDDYATRNQLFRIKLRALYYRLRYINHTQLFAQDHLVFSSQLIGRNKYTMVEDAPGSYTTCLGSKVRDVLPKPTRLRPKLRRLLLWGPVYGQFFGRNEYCENRWVTEKGDEQSPVLKSKYYTLLDLQALWDSASEGKKQYIYRVFGLDDTILESLQHSKTIIFTEAFAEEGLILEEAATMFAPYVEKFKDEGVVIKPHPRDYMDWNSVFPDVTILKTRVPMQILCIMGVDFKRAITVCSTAISALKSDTEIIWLRDSAHPKWIAKYGKGGKCPFESKFNNIRYV